MKYCKVQGGTIVQGPTELPTSAENVSNFHLLSDQELKGFGWLPYVLVDNKGQNQVFVESVFDVSENQVTETMVYRNLTQTEIDDLNRQKITNEWAKVRNKRNTLLKQCDWTQLNDSPVDRSSWATYRQSLRNIPQNFTDPFAVVFPTPPSS